MDLISYHEKIKMEKKKLQKKGKNINCRGKKTKISN